MIYLYDVNEKRVGQLSNDNPGACPYDEDTWKERLSDALINYEFQAPGAHPGAANILGDGYIIRKAPNGNLMMLQIISIEEDHSGDEFKKIVYTENSGLELLGNYVDPGDYTGKTVEEAAAIALDGTRWELGQADWLGQVDYKEDDFQTSLAIIHGIAASVKGEIQFRVEIQTNGEILRFVDILQRRGRETGRRFEFGHDLKAIKRTIDRAPVATAIVPIGKGGEDADRLTIENIEWKVVNGDPTDKPLGQNWIGDDDARMRWGNGGYHIKKKLETEIEDPAKLIQAAWDELQIKKEPSLMYEMDALTFWGATGSTAAEALQIGDGVGAFDQTFTPELMIGARILDLEYSFTAPEKSKVVTGNYKQLKTNINAQLRAIQSKLIRNEVVWTQGGAKITTGPDEPYLPEIDDFWLDTSNPDLEVWKRWDGVTWRESTPTEANQIAESVGRKWAAQSGADVTGDNTAADTEAVAGKLAETVKVEAEAGNAAKEKIDTEVGTGVIETTQGAAAKVATAKGEAMEFTQTYAQKEITQGAARPTNPEPGDMHIDISGGVGKYKWERFDGANWGPASIVSLSALDGVLAAAQIAVGSIATNHLADDAITNAKIAAGAVTALEIGNGAITNVKMADLAVTAAKLANSSITAEKIENLAVGTAAIADAAITNAKILNLDAAKITTGRLDAARVQIGSGTEFAAGFDPTKIEVGTRNLLRGTSDVKETVTVGQFGYQGPKYNLSDMGLVGGKEITYSVDLSDIPNGQAVKLRFDFYRDDNTYLPFTSSQEISAAGRYSFNYKIPTDPTITKIALRYYPVIYTTNFSMSRKAEKIETGNKATGWSPAPEDTSADIISKTETAMQTAQLNGGWEKTYTVNASTPLALAHPDGTPFNADYSYEVQGEVRPTGTVTGASGIFTADTSGIWSYTKITEKGASSNHIEYLVLNNVPSVRLYAHSSMYQVVTTHRRFNGVGSVGTALPLLWKYANTTFIDGGDIYTNTITANQIAASTITATELAANSVIAAKIAAGAVTANAIAANSITSNMIATAGLDAGVIKFGTMSGDRIQANTITTTQLNVDSLDAISGVFSSDANGTVELDNGRILTHDGIVYASYGKSGMSFGAGNPYTVGGEFYAQFHADANGAKITVADTQEVKLLKQNGAYADLYLDDVFGDKAYLFDIETDYMELVTGQITSATTDTLKFNGNPVGLTSLQPIWSGTLFLHETHTVTPSKKLSECPNGWILVWSRYVNGAISNSDWNTTYIPRRAPNYTANTAGGSVSPTISSGIWCPLPAAAANDVDQPPIAHKLIYVTDTTIKGHRRNGVGTQNGQVLRYVYPF